jgi:hypothetical protein
MILRRRLPKARPMKDGYEKTSYSLFGVTDISKLVLKLNTKSE